MRLITKITLFVLLLISANAQAQSRKQDFILVPITSNPKPSIRLQFSYQNDSVQIWGTNLVTLPRKLRKIKFINPKEKLKIADVRVHAANSLETTFTLQKDTSLGFRTKLLGLPYFQHLRDRFLKGHGNSTVFANQNIHLGTIPAPASWPQNFSAKVPRVGNLSVNYLPAVSLNSLPVYDASPCGPVMPDFLSLRRAQGSGLDKIAYKPYNATRRVTIKKSFDLYFELKSSQPQENQIKAVTDYLEQNQLEILNAIMVGGSSVEGDAQQNKALQRERARVVSQALSRYNKSIIRKDTILLSDNWPTFRQQIKTTPFAWLDSLSNEQIQFEINHNKTILEGLEPILKTQRKASLNLLMAKILTADEQFGTLQKSMNEWIKSMVTPGKTDKEAEQKIMGGLAYLLEQYFNREINQEEVDELLRGDYGDYKYMYLGMHIIKQFSQDRFGPENQFVWKVKWDSLNLEPWFFKGQESLLRLAAQAHKTTLSRYLKMLVDYQAFTYRLISLRILDANILCKIPYPEKPEYMELILNHYAFLYEVSNADCARGYRWMSFKARQPNESDQNTAGSGFQESLSLKSGNPSKQNPTDSTQTETPVSSGSHSPYTGFVPRRYISPTYDSSVKDPYYYLLKQVFVKGNKEILKYFEGDPSLNAFNLYHLLTLYTFPSWKPDQNYFYDKEVRLEEMERLISLLKKGNLICVPIVNELYLNYHMNALAYLELYFEPGNTKHREIAYNSLRFISEYYKKRIGVLEADVPAVIAMYLNRFNWIPGTKEGAWFGFDLMNAVAIKRKLTEPELKLWANYLKVYDPELKKPLPKLNPIEVVQRAMNADY